MRRATTEALCPGANHNDLLFDTPAAMLWVEHFYMSVVAVVINTTVCLSLMVRGKASVF